jgi:hypothetical protein
MESEREQRSQPFGAVNSQSLEALGQVEIFPGRSTAIQGGESGGPSVLKVGVSQFPFIAVSTRLSPTFAISAPYSSLP